MIASIRLRVALIIASLRYIVSSSASIDRAIGQFSRIETKLNRAADRLHAENVKRSDERTRLRNEIGRSYDATRIAAAEIARAERVARNLRNLVS
jgi:hypothetical protein